MRYKVLAARLAIDNFIFTKDEIVTEAQLRGYSAIALMRRGDVTPIDETQIEVVSEKKIVIPAMVAVPKVAEEKMSRPPKRAVKGA